MGRQPRSGDIPWLSAHSILNWIGGDIYILDPSAEKSSILSAILRKHLTVDWCAVPELVNPSCVELPAALTLVP
jgi:hypothetical protein